MTNFVLATDRYLLRLLKKYHGPLARVAIFITFFWFGGLKVFGTSPAGPLVASLLQRTLPFMSFETFNLCFGIFEMAIGLLFIIPGLTRVVLPLLAVHLITTFLPLIILPALTWSGPFTPTLEGQYIIKNLVIIALAISLAATLDPLKPGGKAH